MKTKNKTKTKTKTKTYQEDLIEDLKDPEFALEYLQGALEESDEPAVFLLALRNIAESRGMAHLAKESNLNRENLYKLLSENGNPQLYSLTAILSSLGFKLTVELKKVS